MSKLTTTTFVTLDGVMQAPGGPEEDRTGVLISTYLRAGRPSCGSFAIDG